MSTKVTDRLLIVKSFNAERVLPNALTLSSGSAEKLKSLGSANSGEDCSLLVMSCDTYRDLWPPFFALLDRHWPDCPFKLYLGAENFSFDDRSVTTLRFDAGRNWSLGLKQCLGQIPSKYVLLMLEDFFLREDVASDVVLRCLDFAKRRDATQVRLIPRPGPTSRLDGETLFGECEPGSPYRLCVQAAVWNRLKLKDLLKSGETIWDFEHNGNVRASSERSGFYCAWRSVLPYQGVWAHHVVEKGLWLPEEKWIFGRRHIGCDFSVRGTLPWHRTFFYHLAQTLDRLLGFLPWRDKVAIKLRIKSLMRPFFRTALERLGQNPHNGDSGP